MLHIQTLFTALLPASNLVGSQKWTALLCIYPLLIIKLSLSTFSSCSFKPLEWFLQDNSYSPILSSTHRGKNSCWTQPMAVITFRASFFSAMLKWQSGYDLCLVYQKFVGLKCLAKVTELFQWCYYDKLEKIWEHNTMAVGEFLFPKKLYCIKNVLTLHIHI